MSALDAWVRDTWLPELPDGALIVLAGRAAPSTAWRTDPGWTALSRIVELKNFDRDESQAYLESTEVPAAARANVLDFTHDRVDLVRLAVVLADRPRRVILAGRKVQLRID